MESSPIDYAALEKAHVQEVYEAIAPHFSATRYKPWPVVENFLNSIQEGSVGADVGCGNGKYLGVNPNVVTIGSDMSSNLVSICRQRGFESMVCDNLSLPYRDGCFDFVISIAVIHHFSSFERRVAAVKELSRTLRRGGKLLIFVWAQEQEDGSKRRFDKQDVFVPWNLDAKSFKGGNAPTRKANSVESTANALGLGSGETKLIEKSGNQNVVYQRYYHVFVKGELDSVVDAAGGLQISVSGYDRDNWYVIATKS